MPAPDVLIVGGGLAGLAVARQLKLQGASVCVLERHQPAREASWAGAGMLAPQGELGQGNFLRLCLESNRLYPEFVAALEQETGLSCGLRAAGTLAVALTESDAAELVETFASQLATGMTVEMLTAQEIGKLEPGLRGSPVLALHFPEDGHVENRMLVSALEQSCRRLGVDIVCGAGAVRLLTTAGRASGVETVGEIYHAASVINAAGAWAASFEVPDIALRPPVFPVRGQMMALEMPRHNYLQRVVRTPRTYLIPCRDGRLMIGATVEEVGFDKRNTAGGLAQLVQGAAELLPDVGTLAVREVWAGLRPGTPDHYPYLGATACPGYFLATGLFRNGILLAPVVAREIAALVLTGVTSALIQPFGIDR